MSIFNLPDLGEGLAEAEIHEWYVKVGDEVKLDQPIVAMETAKAVVDVPAAQNGIIKKLYGEPGSVIRTGHPLLEFEALATHKPNSSTVVGQLEEHGHTIELKHLNHVTHVSAYPKASIAVKRYAQQHDIDLKQIIGSGEYGVITQQDLNDYLTQNPKTHQSGYEALKGVRKQMAKAMELSHREVVSVSIFDDIDISHWKKPYDITVRMIESLVYAAEQEPQLNAWFNGHGIKKFSDVNVGLAVDSVDGLFVPVLEQANRLSSQAIREQVNRLKQGVLNRSLAPEAFQNATISLSNFGKFAGKYASPIIVPPMVAILAVGRLFDGQKLPLSLSFDHRAVTGGEATRFLGAIMEHLNHYDAGS